MNKTQLSKSNRWIIEQCQRVNFGRITFHVLRGEPDLAQQWHTRQTVKLAGGENGPRPEAGIPDFGLRKEQVALLDQLSHVPDGVCVIIEVKHGLPFLLEIEQDHQVA